VISKLLVSLPKLSLAQFLLSLIGGTFILGGLAFYLPYLQLVSLGVLWFCASSERGYGVVATAVASMLQGCGVVATVVASVLRGCGVVATVVASMLRGYGVVATVVASMLRGCGVVATVCVET
jgi:hypothetical protein